MVEKVEAPRLERLPYGIGRLGAVWFMATLGLLALVGLGAYAYSRQLMEGEIVTGMRDVGTMGGAPWGLYIAFVVYFVGVSFAGITVAALVRVMNLSYLRPVSRTAELLTVITLILGAFSVLADVGQPFRALINLPRYARPMSPFFGTFTLVISGYLFASLVYFYLAGRRDAYLMAQKDTPFRGFYRLWAAGYRDTPEERKRHDQTSFWLALAILPLLVTAHSTLGFVFGIQLGRPGWYSALQAPGFVMLAGVSGTGLLIVIAALLRQVLGEREQLNLRVFVWLSNFMTVLALIYLYFLLAEMLTAGYAGHHHEARLTQALLTGRYAWLFWLSGGLLFVSALMGLAQALTRRHYLPLIVLTGVLVNIAAIGKRFLIVAPSLTMGNLLPYGEGAYAPTWVEYSIILGLFALGGLLYTLFMKVFPIMEVVHREVPVEAPVRAELQRRSEKQ
ncbi:MAG: NrfD/PsrC family molybdoenzyme membrane anchor subunit [Dehalococcoidia bacterium]